MSTNLAWNHCPPDCLKLPEVSQRAVRELDQQDLSQVRTFLSRDSIRNVNLRGMIEDYGLRHPVHRGRFFGYYEDGRLAGVALLGHLIAMSAEDSALRHFAHAAAAAQVTGHVILGPRAQVESFWEHFARHGRETRRVRDYRWYICHQPRLALKHLQLRQASLAELSAVAEAQADMAYEESGTDPRLVDREGFSQRVAERIKRGRVWVKTEGEKLVFKVDILSNPPGAAYLEGIWTHPGCRNQGIAKSCLTELAHRLLRQRQAICLMAEPHKRDALRVYEEVGFVYRDDYQARFLQPFSAAG
jgi:hypothetical protein